MELVDWERYTLAARLSEGASILLHKLASSKPQNQKDEDKQTAIYQLKRALLHLDN